MVGLTLEERECPGKMDFQKTSPGGISGSRDRNPEQRHTENPLGL
jgi:hypothetical protein